MAATSTAIEKHLIQVKSFIQNQITALGIATESPQRSEDLQ
jgi:hypothetical protein